MLELLKRFQNTKFKWFTNDSLIVSNWPECTFSEVEDFLNYFFKIELSFEKNRFLLSLYDLKPSKYIHEIIEEQGACLIILPVGFLEQDKEMFQNENKFTFRKC